MEQPAQKYLAGEQILPQITEKAMSLWTSRGNQNSPSRNSKPFSYLLDLGVRKKRIPYWDLRRKRRQNNDLLSSVIIFSSPLTWNIPVLRKAFTSLSYFASSVLPCGLPSMSHASFYCLPVQYLCASDTSWSQLCSTRQHTKTKVKS